MPDSPTAAELERYLHTHIPLSKAMGVAVRTVDGDGVRLAAPLDPNINHRGTAFGGSLSTLAILAGWTLVHARLRAEGITCQIVIQRSEVEYLRPVEDEFEAVCPAPDPAEWTRFLRTVRRRARGRVVLGARLLSAGTLVGTSSGTFVAAATGREDPGAAE